MLKKLTKLLSAAILTGAMSLYATVSLEWTPTSGDVVKGVAATTTQTIGLYATTAGENVTTFNIKVTLPEGISMADGVTAGTTTSVVWNDSIFTSAANNAVKTTVTAGVLTISAAPTASAKLGQIPNLTFNSGTKTKICDVTFAIDVDGVDEATDSVNIPAEMSALQIDWKASEAYSTDNLKLMFVIFRESFNFTTLADAEFDEVNVEKTYTIDFTDKTLFTCKAWDGNTLKETTKFKITKAEASDANAGVIAQDGDQKVTYTPAIFYNGEFTINYTVESTDPAVAGSVDGSITVKVNDVNFPPAVAITEVPADAVAEEAPFTFTFKFKDGEGRNFDDYNKALTADGNDMAIDDVSPSPIPDDAGFSIYTITARAPYATIAHNGAASKQVALAMTITLKNDETCVASDSADFTVTDTDQAPEAIDFAVAISPAEAFVNDSLTAAITENFEVSPDPDGDAIAYDYAWKLNDADTDYATATVPATVVKRGEKWTVTATPYTTVFGEKKNYPEMAKSADITIGNSAPVITTADNTAIFIRKGAEMQKSVTITATDADTEDVLSVVITEQPAATKCTAQAEGMVITITVPDTADEFADEDAAVVKYIVKDADGAQSEERALVVTYRDNPPPELVANSLVIKQNGKNVEAIEDFTETDKAITINLKAQDGYVDGAPAPSGITGFEVVVLVNDKQEAALPAWIKVTSGTSKANAAATFTATITPSYDMIVNGTEGNRPSKAAVKVLVNATDGDNVTATVFESAFTVSDVDRQAAAPKTVVLKGIDGDGNEVTKISAAEKIQAVVTPGFAEITDSDNDAVTGYNYTWKINGEIQAETTDTIATGYGRNDKVVCEVAAITKPYSDSDEVALGTPKNSPAVTITNTPPEAIDGTATTLEDTPVAIDLNELKKDIDNDVLTFAVDAKSVIGGTVALDAKAGMNSVPILKKRETVALDAKAGIATFTPAKNFNGEAEFKFIAIDPSNAKSAPATVKVTVTAVNDQPTVNVTPVSFVKDPVSGNYVATTVSFDMYAGAEDESEQTFELIADSVIITDENHILNGIAWNVSGNKLELTATPVENPDPAAKATIAFKVKDNGGTENGGIDTSEEYSVLLCTNPPPTIVGNAPAAIDDITETGKAVKLTLKAADGKIDGAPAPSGIKGFELVAFIDGVQQETLPAWAKVNSNGKSQKASPATFTATLTPKYTMIANGDNPNRPSTQKAKFQIYATDGDGIRVLLHETNEFTITDVDQQTAAPTAVKLVGYKIVDGAVTDTATKKITTIDAIKAVVTPSIEDMNAAIAAKPTTNKYDKDGDTITGFKYVWSVNGTVVLEGEGEDTLKGEGVFTRGQKVTCEVFAIAKPYADKDEVLGKGRKSPATTIANSAPIAGDFAVVTDEDVALEFDMNSEEYIKNVVDPDGDTFTFSADKKSTKGGKVAIKNGVITYTPAPEFSGEDSFQYIAKDKGGASSKGTITVTVNDINDAPEVTPFDFFVSTLDIADGKEQSGSFTAVVGPVSEKELGQKITAAAVTVDPEFAGLITAINATPVDNDGDFTVKVTFTVSKDAVVGMKIPCTITVTDDGTPAETSEEMAFAIVIGDTPWYPIHTAVTTDLGDEYDGIIFYVHLLKNGKPGTSTLTILKVEKDENGVCTILPAHYFANNFIGLKPGNTYYFEEYYMKGGKTAGLATKFDSTNAGLFETIDDYTKPDANAITVSKAADAEDSYDVNVPLGKSFVLKVYNSKKRQLKSYSQKFLPGETGDIVRPYRLSFDFQEGYYVTVVGSNPVGSSAVAKFTYEEVMGAARRSGVKPAIFPADGTVLYTADDAADIDFTWPTAAKAVAYSLAIYDESGAYVTGINNTELANVTLNLEPGNYRWVVATELENGIVTEDGHAFTIVKESDAPIVNSIASTGNGLSIALANAIEGEELALDIQYIDAEQQLWNNAKVTATVIDGKLVISDIPAAAGAYIFVRFEGEANYSTYIVK